MSSLAHRTARRSLAVWLLLVLALSGVALWYPAATVLPGPTSMTALQRDPAEQLARKGGIPLRDTLLVVLSSRSPSSADRDDAVRTTLTARLRALINTETQEPLFQRVETVGHNIVGDEYFRSNDSRHTLLVAEVNASIDRSASQLRRIPQLLDEWRASAPDYDLYYLSDGTATNEMFALINRDLDHSLYYTLPLTAIVLLCSFHSLGATLLVLGISVGSLGASLGAASLMSHLVAPMSATALQLVVLLVLALGIDYGLFLLTRVRGEVRHGLSFDGAVACTRDTTGRAIALSGLTVGLSLLGLLLMQDTVLTSMALVSLVAVGITLWGSLAALPAAVLLLGERLEWGTFPRSVLLSSGTRIDRGLSFALEQPGRIAFLAGALLLLMSCFVFNMRLGSTIEARYLPPALQSVRAAHQLERAFPRLAGIDLSVVLRADKLTSKEEDGAIEPLLEAVEASSGVRPLRVIRSEDGDTWRLLFRLPGSANTPTYQELVRSLRANVIPETLRPLGIEAQVGGTLAYVVDERDRYVTHTTRVFAGVLGLSMLFLLLAFRSVIVPLKAIALNLLSAGASYGILVLVFQRSSATGDGVIESFVPALLFAILFGLSMDYHLFLLSRIREELTRGSSPEAAVKAGILATWKPISSAALIMVTVFAVIASLELPVMQQLGIGLTVAILLDATLIRGVLLPATMILLGRWNWYLPTWLEWLPRWHGHGALQGPPEERRSDES